MRTFLRSSLVVVDMVGVSGIILARCCGMINVRLYDAKGNGKDNKCRLLLKWLGFAIFHFPFSIFHFHVINGQRQICPRRTSCRLSCPDVLVVSRLSHFSNIGAWTDMNILLIPSNSEDKDTLVTGV